jgi:3-dehydroquinate dehydratase I
MNIKYCLPIIKTDQKAVLEMVRANLTSYTYFEVWLDYIENVDDAFIEQLIKLLKKRLIVVFRRQELEAISMDSSKRKHILSLLGDSQVTVDLDITTQKDELDYLKKCPLGTKTIISYHNYEKTPNLAFLRRIVESMTPYHPGVYKIATMCHDENHAVRLMRLLVELKEKRLKYIILGMGKSGIVTRIFGTLWGNEMIFAPEIIAEQSASGQLTRNQLTTIFEAMKG